MATPINTLQSWFVTMAKPLQEQFWAWISSFRHLDIKINLNDLDTDVLNALAAGGSITAPIIEFDVLGVFDVPPLSKLNGGTYGVGSNPVDEFTNRSNQIAVWNNSTGWSFLVPVVGNYRYNTADATTAIYLTTGGWSATNGLPILNQGNDISSGVVIGTKNDAPLDFKTKNIRRGGFDSVGNFDIASLAGNSTTMMLVVLPDGKLSAQTIPTDGGGGGTGVSITGAQIDVNGHLIISYSNGTTDDAGYVMGGKGDKGDTGAQGSKGDKGETGAQGSQGVQGTPGATGAKGDKGDTGATGAQGVQGIPGTAGAPGATGAQGVKGDKGDTGAAGANGTNGQGLNFRGAWQANTNYVPYDIVTYGGSTYESSTSFTSGSTFNLANWNLWARGNGNAFTLSFNYPVRIFQDYYETAISINSIVTKDVGTLSYSTDGNTYTVVSLPLSASIPIAAGTWVWWKITFATGKTNCSAYFKIS